MTVSYAALVAHVSVDGPTGPSTGARPAVVALGAYVAVVLAALCAGSVVTGARRRAFGRAAASLVLLCVAVVLATRGEPATTVLITAVHLVAVAVWLGGVLQLAFRRSASAPLRDAVQAFTAWAVGSAALVAGTGTVLALRDNIGLRALVSTTLGVVVLAKVVLLLAAAGLGLLHRWGRSDRQPTRLRVESGVLATALGLGAALVAVPAVVPAVVRLGPGLSEVRFGSASAATVFVATDRQRAQLLLLSDETLALQDLRGGETHQLEPGRAVALPQHGGHVHVRLLSGRSSVDVTLPAQQVSALSDGTLPALLARDLAVGGNRVPGTVACAPTAGALGLATGRLLRTRGLTSMSVLSDGAAQSRDFVAGLQSDGITVGPRRSTLLIATTPTRAQRELASLGSTAAYTAVVLAPWLLDGDVLATVTAHRLPPVLLAGRSDAMAPVSDRYRGALAALGGGLAPTVSGLDAYAAAAGEGDGSSLTLFAATPISFLPGVLDTGHTHQSSSWLPGGSLVPVAHPIPAHCTTTTTTGTDR